MERTSKPLSDRVFYTVYRFFEEVHGPGDAAEVAAVFKWCFLLLMNIVAALILLFVLIGKPALQDNVLAYVFGGIGILVSVTQYLPWAAIVFRHCTSHLAKNPLLIEVDGGALRLGTRLFLCSRSRPVWCC